MGEKSEKATPKKLRDARKKGQVAKSQDLPSAFTFVVSIVTTLALSTWLYGRIGTFLIQTFKMSNMADLSTALPAVFMEGILLIYLTCIPIMAAVSVFGVIINFLAVGPVFSLEVFKFDPKKFDPVQNLKAKFKMKTLVELIKSIIKLSVACYLIYGVVYRSIPVLAKTVALPLPHSALIFHAFLLEVVIKVGLFFLIVAIMDFAYQKYSFGKEMMMEKFEVKQEYKNTEGDPHIKGKRKQIAQEIAYSEGPAQGVKKAAAVVSNPTHIAVAIAYHRELDAAPYIVSMGEGPLAERILHFADLYGVPVVRNIDLAHKLWNNGEVYEYIPEDTYEAIAEVLSWIKSLNRDESEIDIKLPGTPDTDDE
jgi:type III secretion protein U